MKNGELLKWGEGKLSGLRVDGYDIEAEVLLRYVLGVDKISNFQFPISKEVEKKYKNLIFKRCRGVPLAYLTNHKKFCGLDFYVNERVLIPRPETERLVEVVLEIIVPSCQLSTVNCQLLDMGTGSGCIITSIIKGIENFKCFKGKECFKNFKFVATDISADALKVAKINAKRYGVLDKIKFIQSDLFEKLPVVSCQLLVANLPYVEEFWQDPSIQFEPKQALYAGQDGLDVYRRFFQQVWNYTKQGSVILIEIDLRQVKPLKKIIGKRKIEVLQDRFQKPRVLKITV